MAFSSKDPFKPFQSSGITLLSGRLFLILYMGIVMLIRQLNGMTDYIFSILYLYLNQIFLLIILVITIIFITVGLSRLLNSSNQGSTISNLKLGIGLGYAISILALLQIVGNIILLTAENENVLKITAIVTGVIALFVILFLLLVIILVYNLFKTYTELGKSRFLNSFILAFGILEFISITLITIAQYFPITLTADGFVIYTSIFSLFSSCTGILEIITAIALILYARKLGSKT